MKKVVIMLVLGLFGCGQAPEIPKSPAPQAVPAGFPECPKSTHKHQYICIKSSKGGYICVDRIEDHSWIFCHKKAKK